MFTVWHFRSIFLLRSLDSLKLWRTSDRILVEDFAAEFGLSRFLAALNSRLVWPALTFKANRSFYLRMTHILNPQLKGGNIEV